MEDFDTSSVTEGRELAIKVLACATDTCVANSLPGTAEISLGSRVTFINVTLPEIGILLRHLFEP